ncbi:MAG: amidohydrolase family protein [Chloroflexi bacterium]|nr:amidohydrolase family protein [Chloroflexota bacterium]
METKKQCDLLLRGGIVITVDDERRVFDPGAVAVLGDKILDVGSVADLADYQATRTIDCQGKLITPGFVDCHNHLFESLLRGVGEGMELYPWLAELLEPFSDRATREEAVSAVLNCSLEAIRNGTTCVIDNHYGPTDLDTTLAVADAIQKTGLRGAVARGMYGPATDISDEHGYKLERTFMYSVQDEIDITRDAMKARPPGSKVVIWPAPENVSYNPHELVIGAAALAREFGTRWHTHLAEGQIEDGLYREQHGMGMVEKLSKDDLLRDGTYAHAIWLSDKDIEMLGEAEAGIAHCPVSNQYLATGIMRMHDLREAGAVIGLGSDGSCCGNQDLILAMRSAVILQRVNSLDPTVATAEDALEMATVNGARYAGIEAGQLIPGKLADVIVIGIAGPQNKPFNRALGSLVYNGSGSDVEISIVGGEIIYEGGKYTNVDEISIKEEVQIRADELFERLELEKYRMHWIKQP